MLKFAILRIAFVFSSSSRSERGMWSRDPHLTPHWPGYLRGAALPPPARLLPLLRAAAAQGDAAQVPRVRGARRHHPAGIYIYYLLYLLSIIYNLSNIYFNLSKQLV